MIFKYSKMNKSPEILDKGNKYTVPDAFGKPRSHFYATNSMLNYEYGGPLMSSVKHIFGEGGFKPMAKNIPSPYQFAGTKIYRDTTEIPSFRQGGTVEKPWLNNLYADGGGLFDRFKKWKEKNVDEPIAAAEPTPGVQQIPEMQVYGDEAKKKLHKTLMDKVNALWDTVQGRKVWAENGPKNYSIEELQKFVNGVKDYNQQAQRYERDKRLVEKGELSTDVYAQRFNEGNWARFDENTGRENFKGEYQQAVEKGNKEKEEYAKRMASDAGNTFLEYSGINGLGRTMEHPIETLSDAGQTIVDIGMAAPELPYRLYDYATNFYTPWNRTTGQNSQYTDEVNPITGQPYWSGAQGAIDLFGSLPFFKLGTTAATAGVKGTINAVNKIPASRVLLQSAEQRLGNPTAYNLLQGTETGVRGKVANKYFGTVQKNIEKEADQILKKSIEARKNGFLVQADDIYRNEYIPKLQEVQAVDNRLLDWRLKYSGLPLENTGMGGGEGALYSLKGDPTQLAKVGKSFNTEAELNDLIEVGKNYQYPGARFAFPTRQVRFAGGNGVTQFMPKLNYQAGMPTNATTADLAKVAEDMSQRGIGIDYAGLDNIGRVGDDMGFVDLTYIGKPGQRTSAYDWSMFHPEKNGRNFKLQEIPFNRPTVSLSSQGLVDDALTVPIPQSNLKSNLKGALGNLKSFGEEVVGSIVNKNRAQTLREAEDWMTNWMQHPVTQQKIQEGYKFGLHYPKNPTKFSNIGSTNIPYTQRIISSPAEVHNLGEGIKYSSGYNAAGKLQEYPLGRQAAELLQLNTPGIHKGNFGVSFTHHTKPGLLVSTENTLNGGISPTFGTPVTHPRYGNWVSRTLNPTNRFSTGVHELTHDAVKADTLLKTGQSQILHEGMDPNNLQNLILKHADDPKVLEDIGYYSNPAEIHARVMEARKHFNLTPEMIITPDKADDMMTIISKGKTPIEPNWAKLFPDSRRTATMFNKAWMAPAVIGGGTAATLLSNPWASDKQQPMGLRQGGPFQTSYYSSDVRDNYYAEGGSLPKPYSFPEDSFKQGGRGLHNSIYASTPGQYPQPYENGGSLVTSSSMPMIESPRPNLIPASAFEAPVQFYPEVYADIEKSDGTSYKQAMDGTWYISGPRAKNFELMKDPAGIWADSLQEGIRQARIVPTSQIPIEDNSSKV